MDPVDDLPVGHLHHVDLRSSAGAVNSAEVFILELGVHTRYGIDARGPAVDLDLVAEWRQRRADDRRTPDRLESGVLDP